MKTVPILFLLLISAFSNAQTLAGSYEGATPEGKLQIQLQSDGSGKLTGTVSDEQSGIYSLQGVEEMGEALGVITASNGSYLYFEAYMDGDQLHLIISPMDANGDIDYNNISEFVMKRSEAGTVAQPSATTQPQVETSPKDNYERDQGLVGYWTYSESYTSGTYSFASQWKMQINPDGTYLYGDGKVAGGGEGISGSSEGGDVERGYWRTQNGIIYISSDNRNWQPYCGYYLEGYKLMLKFEDGTRQVWSRQ